MLTGMKFETYRSRLTVLAVMAALAQGGLSAQGGQKPQGGGAPLLIDFTAIGADGKPVVELAPADVQIKVGGKARTVTGLELKKVQATAAPAAGAPAAAAPAGDTTAPFFTNEAKAAAAAPAAAGASVSRSVLIVVDTESLTPGGEAGMKAALGALLEGLGPGDRVALSTAPRDTAQVGFGTSLARVREAVNALKGQKPGNVSAADALCRTSQTLALVSSLIQPLAANTTPTAVVFVAGGLSTPDKQTGSAGTCEVVQGDYQRVADAAGESRVNMYVVQGDQGVMGRDNGLETFAGVTGAGAVLRVTGDGIAPRILTEASTYWVATLAPDPSDRPGQAQQLDVKTTKDGVTIHARKMAAASRTMPAAAAAAGPAKPGTASTKDMLASQAAYTDLQLRAAAIVQRGTGDQMVVLVQAEPVDQSLKIKEMKVGFFDANNKGGSTDPKQIATYPITVPMSVPAGQYRIRVAATDTNGKSGAVDLMVNTALTAAGPLKVSGMMIGAPQGESGMKPQLAFTNEPNVIVFLELYGQLTAGISVKFEVAKSDAGAATDTYPPAGGGPTNEPDKLQVFGKIPIDKLAAGDYVIRALVQMEGQPEGKVMRTIRITK